VSATREKPQSKPPSSEHQPVADLAKVIDGNPIIKQAMMEAIKKAEARKK